MNIVIQYDSSAANAPAGFKTAVQAAVAYYDSLITTNITVPIVFSYGEIEGQKLGSGALGESDGNGYFLTYNQVKADLAKTATSASDILSVLNMPTTDPTHGGTFWVTDAQAKAFGITGNPNFVDPEDGFVGLTSKYALDFSATNRSVSGQYDAVGILEHEISEVLGRTSGLATWSNNGVSVYTPLDLFRYSSAGVRDLTGTGTGYFSTDGQTLLNPFNTVASGADPGDWGPDVVGDSYGYGSSGQAGLVSSVDQLEMDVLGYTLSTTPTTTPAAVSLSFTQFTADTATLAQITANFSLTVTGVSVANRASVEAAAHVTAVTISDTGAAIAAALATLNADTEIGSIVIADNAAITVTSAQKTADAHALAELINANGTAAVVTVGTGGGVSTVVTASAATLSGELDSLNANTALTSVVISDNAALTFSVSQGLNDTHLLGELKDQNGQAYVLNIKDTAATVAAHLDALNGAAHIGAITLTDTNRLTLTAAQVATDAIALSKVSGAWSLTVSDTAANLTSALSTLKSNSHLAALTITDSGPITLTNAQYNADFAVLAKIGGAHVIDVTGLTGLGYTSEIFAYNSSGTLTTETFQSANAVTVYGLSANQTFASPTVAETIWALAGGDTFVIAPGAASETINGFNLASDVLSFSHTLFTTPASVLADAASDGHGGVLIHQGALKIDLAGVSLAQLQQHSSDFHFY